MKLRITKKGIRLYVRKNYYLRVERCLLLIIMLGLIIGTPIYFTVKYFTPKKLVMEEQYTSFEFGIPVITIDNPEMLETKEEEVQEEQVEEVVEQPVQETQPVIQEQPQELSTTYETRMTSYYPYDGPGTGECTGAGLCPKDFQTNEYGWFTYQGKLVVATATTYLANQGWYLAPGVHTYKYYNEITLTIDGVDYPAIVLDSCGHAMKSGRIDLFVKDANSVKDTMITVKE